MEKKINILVEALTNGKNSAKRLQNLLSRNDLNTDEIVSIDDLVMDVTKSFVDGLSVLSSCGSTDPEPQEIEETPPPLAKQGRGQYKRRTSMDSRVKVSDTPEDGYQWRKYGQKEILNSKFPRCYFRCTYKHDLGCMASKHVQQLEKTNEFRITYFGRHTCHTTPHNRVVPHDNHGVVLDFEAFKNHGYTTNIPSTTNIKRSRKRKSLSNRVSSTNDARSSPSLVSEDLIALDDLYPHYETPGSDNGGSSPSIISAGLLGMDIFEKEVFLREFMGDDVHDGIILESFGGLN